MLYLSALQNMNTVLDDNMMLCLANGERIKLKPDMRMLFEVCVCVQKFGRRSAPLTLSAHQCLQ